MPEDEEVKEPLKSGRGLREARILTRRRVLTAVLGVAIGGLVLVLLSVVFYRTGVLDSYIRAQFVAKMADIGIAFDADVFRVTVDPLALELQNATFNDRTTGDKLFFIRSAHLELTVRDLWAWQLSRDISIDKTEVSGAEVWIKFDEQGRSNFSNLTLIEEEEGAAVNFRYESIDVRLQDTVVHFGDLSRNLSGDARNVVFLLSPETYAMVDEPKRYRFDLTATDSTFTYDTSTVEKIGVRAQGVADRTGAEFSRFDIRTPIGESAMTGRLTDWASPRYDFDVRSTIDLTQASSIFQAGTSLTGVGNFKGRVSGHGETYRIEGEADSAALRADGVYLKAVNVAATVNGTNNSYDATGTAIAQMLTFDDFRVDVLKLVGNIRGTGTDFRWLGELQAAAASTPSLTLGGIFLADALAEYKDRELRAQAGSGRARRFEVGDQEFEQLQARTLAFSRAGGETRISAASGQAGSLRSRAYRLNSVSGSNLKVTNAGGRTDMSLDNVRSQTGEINGARLSNVTADRLNLTDRPSATELTATNLRAGQVDASGTRIDGVEAPEVALRDSGGETVIYSDRLRVAKIDAGSAVLGSLNIGGVRLTIRQGRVEGRSDDIDAGDVTLTKSDNLPTGGTLAGVKVARPVFVLEPSGRYRVTADMSLGGGALGSVALGAARARVEATNGSVALNDLNAAVMDGSVSGNAVIALGDRARSTVTGTFRDLDVGKLLALQIGRAVPVEGRTTGTVDVSFNGTELRNASGTLRADITATAGDGLQRLIPINGRIDLNGVNGLFDINAAELRSDHSNLNATGRFDLRNENSALNLALRSSDASEIDRLVRVLGVSPEVEQQLDAMQVQFAGNLTFDGSVTGNLYDPVVSGRAALDSLLMRGREVGRVTTAIAVSPTGVELTDGRLQDRAGGSAVFNIGIPSSGINNTEVRATLTDINAGNLLAALPVTLPERIRDLDGRTSGTVDIRGLPNAAQGQIDLAAASGTVAGQAFDDLKVKAVFSGTLIELQQGEMRIGAGRLTASGKYDRSSEAFDMTVTGDSVPAPLALAFLPENENIPVINGDVDITADVRGILSRTSSYNVNFNGTGRGVRVGENPFGDVTFKGNTVNQVLTADLTAVLDGRPQVVNATLNFGNDDLPFMVATQFDQSPLAPFIQFVPQLRGIAITGTGTGRVEFAGNISRVGARGSRTYSAEGLNGRAEFTQLSLQIEETPLSAAEPVLIRFNTREVVFERARFSGGGSNMIVAGTKALTDDGINDLTIEGRVNLSLLNLATRDTFFGGFADNVSIRLAGPNSTARLSGSAKVVNGSIAAFLGNDRFTADRIETDLIFTTNQVQFERASGYLGGGRFRAEGGGILDGLSLKAFRLSLTGENVTVPLPKDFITTGDARLEVTGLRGTANDPLQLTIGGRVYARRSLYSKDIDLASIVSGRRDPILSGGGSAVAAPRFDGLVIEGRDALIVRNNIADLTASVSLVLSGDANDPHLTGRITANSGTILFRKDRYVVQRGVLEFPPDTAIEPIIHLQAESEIAGYQIFINLSGPLTDTELLTANVRSSPALPQADVVSLITTGQLTNTAGGISTVAQTGISTAAEILTDTIINNPARRATDKLFGLNVFEIDPIISGQQLNPSARLTVGRQINNNLRVTYATNLSQDQQQVLALEYRVSNRLSFVAQYEQRSLTNVTRNRDNFSFEIRFRRRF
jgi:translocation and assembly module TamB